MLAYFAAIGFTLALWWSSTIAILYLDRLPDRTFHWSMAGGTIALVAALWGVLETRGDTSLLKAYVGFACGIAIWGWQLLSFYLGFVTGPRRDPCEPSLGNWARFREGVRTSFHHELVVLAFGGLLIALTWNQPNKSALWTYLVLYWMHQSAKLNLFFGAQNHGESLLPDHLKYLASFMKRRPMNLFFPLSVTASTIVAVLLAKVALAGTASPFEVTLFSMLACLMALAVLEHWFLVLPLDVDALWQRGMPTANKEAPASTCDENIAARSSNNVRQQGPSDFDSDYEHPTNRRPSHAKAPETTTFALADFAQTQRTG